MEARMKPRWWFGIAFLAAPLFVIVAVAEHRYRRDFLAAAKELEADCREAHRGDELFFAYYRYESQVPGPKVCLTQDVLEAARMRLPRWIGSGSRLNPRAEGFNSTAYSYFGLEISHDLAGGRIAHFFIWSPRNRRFEQWFGVECGYPGCPGFVRP